MTRAKKHSFLAFGLLCAAVVVLTGCQGKVQPKLVLKEGDSRVLRIGTDLTTTVTMMGQEQKTPEQMNLVFAFDVESVDESGTATVKVSFQEGELPGMGQMGPMADQMGDLGDISLEGKSFTMTVTPDGKVESVEGMNAIVGELADVLYKAAIKMLEDNPMMSQMMGEEGAQQMEQVKSMMQGMMKKMLREQMGDEAMREQMEATFCMYPEEPIGVGDQWTKTQIHYKGRPMVVNEVYTLKERKDGVLLIDVESEVLPNESAKPIELMMGMKMKQEFSGKMSGSFKIDENSGWYIDGSATVNLEGKMDTGPMSMPMKIEGTTTVKGE